MYLELIISWVKFGEISIKGLIDKGSNAMCVQMEWFEQNLKKIKKEELPITGINIIMATGKKSLQINSIISTEVEIGRIKYPMQCLVLLNLLNNLLIGSESLWELNTNVDFINNDVDKVMEFNNEVQMGDIMENCWKRIYKWREDRINRKVEEDMQRYKFNQFSNEESNEIHLNEYWIIYEIS